MIRKLSIITNRRGFLKEKKVRFCLHDMVKYGKHSQCRERQAAADPNNSSGRRKNRRPLG